MSICLREYGLEWCLVPLVNPVVKLKKLLALKGNDREMFL